MVEGLTMHYSSKIIFKKSPIQGLYRKQFLKIFYSQAFLFKSLQFKGFIENHSKTQSINSTINQKLKN